MEEGSLVTVHWTNSNRSYRSTAEVERINAKTIVVRLRERVSSALGEYSVGSRIKVPRWGTPGWSRNNCVVEDTPRI